MKRAPKTRASGGGGGGEGNVIFRASNLQVPMFSREKFHKSKHEKTLPIQ